MPHPQWREDHDTRHFLKRLQERRAILVRELVGLAGVSSDPKVTGVYGKISELDAVIEQLIGKGEQGEDE